MLSYVVKTEIANMSTKVGLNDLVYLKERLQIVKQVINTSGFNEFDVVDIESGQITNALRHQLTVVPCPSEADLAGVGLVDSYFEEEITADVITGEQENKFSTDVSPMTTAKLTTSATPPIRERFRQVTEADLEELQAATTAKSTKNQTKWAVKILKGNLFKQFIRFIHLLCDPSKVCLSIFQIV